MWRFQLGDQTDAGRYGLQSTRAAIVTTQGNAKILAVPKHEFLHRKREWNQSANRLASTSLQQETGTSITSESDMQDLVSLDQWIT